MANDWILRSFIDIDLRPMLILLRHVGVREDRFDRTLRYASITIDAGRIDEKIARNIFG